MELSRRDFAKLSAGGAALAALAPVTIMEGCSVNVTSLINAVINSVTAIIRVADPSATWLPGLVKALAALQAAEATWTNTGTVSVIIDALDVLEAVCAVIPLTALYSPLIDILISGIEAVLAALPSQTQQVLKLRAHVAGDPHHGRVPLRKPHFWQSHESAYRSQWNEMAGSINLNAAKF